MLNLAVVITSILLVRIVNRSHENSVLGTEATRAILFTRKEL